MIVKIINNFKMAEEGLAASQILDKSDPTRLTYKEIKASWQTCSNFMRSYGLKPYDLDDCAEALAISRAIKEGQKYNEEEEEEEK